MDQFTVPGVDVVTQRIKLEQYIDPEAPDQDNIPRPKLEEAKTYIYVRVKLTPAVTPLILEVEPKVADIVQKPLPIPKLPSSNLCIAEFKEDLELAMESLA